jgi:hypothetical protein
MNGMQCQEGLIFMPTALLSHTYCKENKNILFQLFLRVCKGAIGPTWAAPFQCKVSTHTDLVLGIVCMPRFL